MSLTEWTWCGVTYEWSAAWGQAWAAGLQAVLSAGAVFWASRLQDKGLQKRDDAIRRRRLEGVASVARYVLGRVNRFIDGLQDGVDANWVIEATINFPLPPLKRAVQALEAQELADEELADAFLDFEAAFTEFEVKFNLLNTYANEIRQNGMAVNARMRMADVPATLFNAAASVERRVAALNGRPAKL